jgi:hypothetical protein
MSASDPVVVTAALTANTTPFTPRNHDLTGDGRFIAAVVRQIQPGTIAPQIQVVLNWFEELKARVPVK